jgi:DNA helicase HerA-like ATPase
VRSEPNGRTTPLSQIRQPTGHAFGRKTADDELPEEDGARRTSSSPRSDHALWASDDEDSAPRADPRGTPAAERESGHGGNGAAPPEQATAEAEAPTGWRAVGSTPKSSLIDELAAEAEDGPPWSEPAVPPDPDRRPDQEAPVGRARKQVDPDDGDDLQGDEFDDIAVTIGRVVSIRGSVVWGALFDDDDGTASRAARMGALVSMRGPDSRVFGIVNALKRDGNGGGQQAERTIFEIQVLGEISTATPGAKAAGFQRGVSSYPPLDAPVTTVTLRDLAAVYARPRVSNVHVGRLRHNHKVPAFVLTDSLLGKHFAVLGTTGAGKSCAVSVILRSILDELPNGHIVLLDPHNEYATAFSDRAELLNPSNLQLPYWLLNFEEIGHILIGGASNEHSFSQTAILKDAILRAKRAFVSEQDGNEHITVDTPMPYRLSDLISALKEGMGSLNKADGSGPYLSLVARIESLRNDRRYAFMFASLAVRDNMRQILAQLLRIPVNRKPITIIDISGVPSEIVDVVVSVLFRLVFELAVWSDRGAAPPVLLVCEEAHRYVPDEDSGSFAPTKRVISRIAKEGRKYGVTLCLVSQRPSELSIGSLAQCNTVFALRLTNEHDQAFVARALPENARWLVDSLPSLNTQEAVVVGDGVTVPVHIRFNDLDPNHRPSSANPSFAYSWRKETDQGFLDRAIDRWRQQVR